MFFDKLFKPKNNLHKGAAKSLLSFHHSIGKTFKSIGHGFHDAGNWTVHAAEDTFKFGKNTVGGAVKWFDGKFDKVAGILDNKLVWIVIGVAIVAVVLKK